MLKDYLLAFVLTVVLIILFLTGCHHGLLSDSSDLASDIYSEAADKSETDVKSDNTNNDNTDNIDDTLYKIKFFDQDNKQISEIKGTISEIVFPDLEKVERTGYVFSGWDKDIEDILENTLTKDKESSDDINDKQDYVGYSELLSDMQDFDEPDQPIDIIPIYIDVRNKENVVAMPAVYGRAGGQFTVPLTLCGKVDICGIDLSVHYDQTKLRLLKAENADQRIVSNIDAEKGEFRMNFVTMTNVTEEIHFCDLVFEALNEKSGEETLSVEVREIIAFDENDEFVTPKTNVINTKIYMY